jgi:uncharacterized protein (TIGR00162 family)
MANLWEVKQEVAVLPNLNDPIMVEGLPGIGNVGKITVDFMIEALKAEKLYSFFSYKFPHSVFVGMNNLVELPKLEIYYKKFEGNKRDLLIVSGDIQPIDEEGCWTFSEEIIKIAKSFNCNEIITTGGIGLQDVPDKPRVFCTANDAKLYKEYATKEMMVEKDIFGVVGPIVGVSGILVGLAKKRGIKSVSLLGETFGHPMYLGVKGAKEILRVLETKFTYGIDLNKINKDIIEVEKELMQRAKEWSSEMTAGAGAKPKKKESSYIG